MPTVSLLQFSNFCEVRPAGQVAIVRQVREQLANPDGFRRHNFWGFMHDNLRKTHLGSGDINVFESSMNLFVMGLSDMRKKEPYRQFGRAYIDYWKQRGGKLFPVSPVSIDIGGLGIRVRPEIGIEDANGDRQVLQIWWKRDSPSVPTRRVIYHLLGQARDTDWDSSWHVGLWDVRKKSVPLPPAKPRDFEMGLAAQAASFLHIWGVLDARSELP